MKSKFPVIFLLTVLLSAQTWQTAMPGYRFEFPRDHFSHPAYQTEWWYYTGNLRSADGHSYGFELTFFRQAVPSPHPSDLSQDAVWKPDQLYLAHLAFSDINGRSFYHTERLNRAGPGLAGAAYSEARYWNGNWQVRWTSPPRSQQELQAVCDRFTLHLRLQPEKPPVIQGQNGVSRKGPLPSEASHYISFTRLAVSGTLTTNKANVTVTGLAWMDHEFFTESSASDLSGWDWFAIQLDNKEELMLYRLREKSGRPSSYSSGSYVDAQGSAHFLSARDFSLTPGQLWQSPHTKAQYPVAWQINVPSLHLNLSAQTELDDQELSSQSAISPSYWEGAMTYAGSIRGQPIAGLGYLEMTGYRNAIRLSGMGPQPSK